MLKSNTVLNIIAVMLVTKALISKYDNYSCSKNIRWPISRRMFCSRTNVCQRNKSRQYERYARISSYNVPEHGRTDNVYRWNIFELLCSDIQCPLASIFDISTVAESARITSLSHED